MSSGPSLLGRAVLAVVLMACFYLLALAIAGGLLWIPYAEWRYGSGIHVKIALVAVVGAGVILWSILPRIDKFEPPGPDLAEGAHPDLFASIHEVASATGQAMPAEVYLVPDMNAFVAQRGGIMGFGSRRVMGLGLPLMQLLTIGEMRAVLAHEFGHFHGGDTKLGPWIYKTRAAIGRTLHGLAESGRTWLLLPFEWYGQVFLRIPAGPSRARGRDRRRSPDQPRTDRVDPERSPRATARWRRRPSEASPVTWQVTIGCKQVIHARRQGPPGELPLAQSTLSRRRGGRASVPLPARARDGGSAPARISRGIWAGVSEP